MIDILLSCSLSNHPPSVSKSSLIYFDLYGILIIYMHVGNIPFCLEGYQSSNINFGAACVIFPITDSVFRPHLSSVSIRV